MNDTPTTLPEVIAYLAAKFTAGTNLSSGTCAGSWKADVRKESATHTGGETQAPQSAQNPLSQTQILHLLELGLANPSKQEDRR